MLVPGRHSLTGCGANVLIRQTVSDIFLVHLYFTYINVVGFFSFLFRYMYRMKDSSVMQRGRNVSAGILVDSLH